jgi:hypothetical protein
VTVFTVDVSNHDWDRHGGALDWGKIRAAGIQAMCAKATEGDPSGYAYTDPYFAAQVRGARAAGMTLAGGYHVLCRGDQNGINRQVDWLRRQLGAVGGLGNGVWAMIDVEPFQELVDQGIVPRWDDVHRFADRWDAVTGGYPLAVYLPRWVWSGTLGSPNFSALRGPVVSSDYGGNPALPLAGLYSARGGDHGPGWAQYGGKTPELWQFGSNAQIPGASSATDVNAYRGTLAQLTARLTGSTQEDDVTPAQEAWLYTVSSIDGSAWQGSETASVRDEAGKTGVLTLGLVRTINMMAANVAVLKTQLADVAGRPPVDPAEVARDVLAALTPASIADAVIAALPADLATQVVNELSTRLATRAAAAAQSTTPAPSTPPADSTTPPSTPPAPGAA